LEPSIFTLKERARRLRHEQTDAEKKLWARLRSRRLGDSKFRRQFVIDPFIVDFCCFEQRLVVELDGGQHSDQIDADQRRTDFLLSRGYRVLRFWDNQVMENIDSVLEQILLTLGKAASDDVPSPFPLPEGEGENRTSNPKKRC
jgi:very-short-patch-repair endonuclease